MCRGLRVWSLGVHGLGSMFRIFELGMVYGVVLSVHGLQQRLGVKGNRIRGKGGWSSVSELRMVAFRVEPSKLRSRSC